jgi:ribose transport system substrate-binding protein
MTVGMQQAVVPVGWTVVLIDGQGDPAKLLAGMNSLVQQGVNAIVIEAVDPALVKQGFDKAIAAHIPIVTEDVGHAAVGVIADVSPDEKANTKLLDEKMISLMGGSGSVAAIRYMSLQTTADRFNQLQADATAHGLNLVASHDSVAPNFADDARTFTKTILQAHPEIKAIWSASTGDPAAIGAAQGVTDVRSSAIVVGYNGDHDALLAIRNGGPFKATIAFPIEEGSWQAMDYLLAQIGGSTDAGKEFYLPAAVVTASNVPQGSDYYNEWGDFGAKFTQNWKTKYGI